MFPFDVILFDVGGVLLTNGWDRVERAAAGAHFGLDAEALETRHATVMEAWERGEIDLNQYLDVAVFYESRPFSRSEFFSFMLAESNPCMIGALNNEARETNEFRFGHFGLRRYFKVAFSSCYMGLRKPEPAMYRMVLDILGCPPERVLFIDDRQENVAGGWAAGMKAIQFTGADALRVALEELGVF